ncbi:MAG TPA: hypothetical protein VF944_09350 [Candidatus Bathyarchaeia archaeon]
MPSLLIRNYEQEGEVSDEEWRKLLDETTISDTKKKVEEKFREIDTDTWNYLRRRAKIDLFFLNQSILGYDRLAENLHGHLCSWMERNKEWRFREILLPRGHLKSTVDTIGDSIQIVLPDVTESEPWPRNAGPDCRLLICHETDGQASNFLFAITGHFLGNPLLMGLFPEIVPSPRKQRINRHELELPRSQTWPEPTIDTMGVGGRSQGRHYNYIKFDDLIGDKARDSEAVMAAAKEWFDNIQSFFSDFGRDHFDLIGTRWAYDDLYSHIHERYGDQLLKYIRGVEEPTGKLLEGNVPELTPIFPEGGFTQDALAILRKNRKVWTAQYANNPEEGATEFDKGWKRWYHWVGFNTIVVFSGKVQTRLNVRDLDICILIDPAMSGLGGFVVTGTDSLNRCFILQAFERDWKPPQLCDFVFKRVARWQPRLVAIEEVLFSGVFKHWFEREMLFRGTYFNIVPISPVVGGRALSKPMRVRGLANYFSSGSIFFPVDGQEDDSKELIKEYDSFGASKKIHMLDALAYGPDVWMPGLSRAKFDQYARTETELMANRDIETGYSM